MRDAFSVGLSVLVLNASAACADTLVEAVQTLWHQSPLITIPLSEQERLADSYRHAGWLRLLPNEPILTYSNTDDNTGRGYGIVETFGFPGKALAYRRSDDSKQAALEAEIKARRYELTKVLVDAYIDSAAANASIELITKNLNDLETLYSSLRARYESGVATQAEVIGTELQVRQMRTDLETAQDKATLAARHLAQFSGTQSSQLNLPDDLDPAIVGALAPITADEARAEAAIKTSETLSRVAWWGELPDLSIGLQRNYYPYLPGSPSGKSYATSYSVGMTLPIFLSLEERLDAQRQIHQARIDRAAAELQRLNAISEREDAKREYERDRKRLADIRSRDLPLAEALFESTFSAYRLGKLGFAELVLARKTLTDLRSQDIQLRSSIISAHLRSLSGGVS